MTPEDFFRKDYSSSPAPTFDAIEDLKKWLGIAVWDTLQKKASERSERGCAVCFARWARTLGVPFHVAGYWWEHWQGGETWAPAFTEAKERHSKNLFEEAFLAAKEAPHDDFTPLILGFEDWEQQAIQEGFEAGFASRAPAN